MPYGFDAQRGTTNGGTEMRLFTKLAVLAAVGTTAAIAAGASVATAAEEAADLPSIVEDFSYPGRDRILAEHGLRLNSGDGNILFVDCSVEGDKIQVESYEFADFVCFQVRGAHGYLSLEIDRAVYIRSDSKPLEATLQIAGEEETRTKDVEPDKWVGIGEAENLPSATLLEIRA
jgi:prepilin-type processing-associated H-X9-DG protein